jgi:hypothetical protein
MIMSGTPKVEIRLRGSTVIGAGRRVQGISTEVLSGRFFGAVYDSAFFAEISFLRSSSM